MPVPNEITYTDMSQLFASGECNGKGSRHVVDGALIRVMPCKCGTCESGKSEREREYIAFEDRLAAAKEALNGNTRRNQPSIG